MTTAKNRYRQSLVSLIVLAALLVGASLWTGTASHNSAADEPAANDASAKVDEAALKRARHQVQVFDDIYKTTVVLITDKYVNDVDDFPAGSAAVALFKHVSEKGWHGVRLIDVSGLPYEEKNVARDEFEKQAVKRLQAGEAYVDAIETKDGRPVLRAMTPVPVVMEKCTMCHDHYKEAKKGAAVGAISYTMPIE
jgi:hypothetical protein